MHEANIAISISDHETCALILTVHTYLLTLYYACIKCLTSLFSSINTFTYVVVSCLLAINRWQHSGVTEKACLYLCTENELRMCIAEYINTNISVELGFRFEC